MPVVEGLVEVQGRRGIVFELVEGPVLLDVIRSRPWALGADLFAELHASVHARIASSPLPALLPRLARRILDLQIEQEMTGARRLRDEVAAALAGLPDGDAVCAGTCTRATSSCSLRDP